MRDRLRILGSVIRDRTLARLVLAFLGFSMAEYAQWIAILVFAYARGGPGMVATISVIQLVPAAIVAPLAAYAGDRFRRDRVLFFQYVVQAAALGATGAAMMTGAPIGVVYVAAAAAGTSMTFTRPTHSALLPGVTERPEDLTAANVASGIVEGLGIMLGPVIAGVILGISGPDAVFIAFSGVSLVGALLVMRLRVDPRRVAPDRDAGATTAWRDSLEGFTTLTRHRDVRTIVVLLASAVLVGGALDVIFVAAAIDLLDLGQSGAGYLSAAFGAGAVVGAGITVALVGRHRLSPPLAGGAGVFGLPVTLLAAVPTAVAAPILFAVGGAGRRVAEVAGRTLLQRVAPDRALTRVFGVLEGFSMLALAVGSVSASALVETFGIRATLVAAGAFVPLMVLISARRLLSIDRDAVAPDEKAVALLRRLAIFEALPAMTLERLARDLEPLVVEAGAAVVVEGDVGERFYVIEEGEASVTEGGRPIATLGAGDMFGEIALLRDVPRTATVTATTAMRLACLAREPFLEALTGHPASRVAVDAVASQRLAQVEGAR